MSEGHTDAPLLTTAQAADAFGYPEQVLLLMIEEGDIQAPANIGGEYRWTAEDIARAGVAIDEMCRAMGCPGMPEPGSRAGNAETGEP